MPRSLVVECIAKYAPGFARPTTRQSTQISTIATELRASTKRHPYQIVLTYSYCRINLSLVTNGADNARAVATITRSAGSL